MRSRGGQAATVLATAALALLAGCSSTSSSSSAPPVTPTRPGGVLSAGCKLGTSASVTNQPRSLTLHGTKRSYLLTTPAAHRTPDPLVLDFHGYGEGDMTESRTSQLGVLGQHDGFITAFPQGTGTPIAWDTSTRPGNTDIAYVSALLDHLEATECIDTARIYATGLSQGAFMTSALACVMSSRIAAFAPVAGIVLPRPCSTKRSVPILAFHGTADPILRFNGGLGRQVLANDLRAIPRKFPKLPPTRLEGAGYPAHVRQWAAKNGCDATPTDTRPSAHVIHRVYACPSGSAVEFDIVLGGGHSWPGSELSAELATFLGPTTMEINASTTMWAFFQRFHLDHPTS